MLSEKLRTIVNWIDGYSRVETNYPSKKQMSPEDKVCGSDSTGGLICNFFS